MIQIQLIAAARPNFMKVAPLYHALKATDWAEPKLVHTGQQDDHNMSDASSLAENLQTVLDGKWHEGSRPPLWDGKTAERAVEFLAKRVKNQRP